MPAKHKKIQILIVDDSVSMRKALRGHLEQDGFQFFEASDGSQGLQTFRENPSIDLILTDINMPMMDGLTMLEKISQLENGRNVRSVVVSTEGAFELKQKAKAVGVLAWIIKLPDPEALKAAVRKILAQN